MGLTCSQQSDDQPKSSNVVHNNNEQQSQVNEQNPVKVKRFPPIQQSDILNILHLEYRENGPKIVIKINRKHVIAIVSTSSPVTIMSKAVYAFLVKSECIFRTQSGYIRSLNGRKQKKPISLTYVHIELCDRKFYMQIATLPSSNVEQTIIGYDFLIRAKIELNMEKHGFKFSDQPDSVIQRFV